MNHGCLIRRETKEASPGIWMLLLLMRDEIFPITLMHFSLMAALNSQFWVKSEWLSMVWHRNTSRAISWHSSDSAQFGCEMERVSTAIMRRDNVRFMDRAECGWRLGKMASSRNSECFTRGKSPALHLLDCQSNSENQARKIKIYHSVREWWSQQFYTYLEKTPAEFQSIGFCLLCDFWAQ